MRAPRIIIVEHERDDPAHLMGDWLREAGAELVAYRPHAGQALPSSLGGGDALLVMGGAMGANDDDTVAWLAPTKDLIRQAVRDEVPFLGICLGHQLGAVALGGTVVRNPAGRQFGVLDIGWTGEASRDALLARVVNRPAELGPARGLQWNDDIVSVTPPGAVVLAQSATGEIQALRLAERAWGVQWHPEADEPLVDAWVRDFDTGGTDPDLARARLDELAAARAELAGTWRLLAQAFVEAVSSRASARR